MPKKKSSNALCLIFVWVALLLAYHCYESDNRSSESHSCSSHSRIIAVMNRIYCDYFGARHLIGDDYTAILLLYTTVSDDFPTVELRFFFNRVFTKNIKNATKLTSSQWSMLCLTPLMVTSNHFSYKNQLKKTKE